MTRTIYRIASTSPAYNFDDMTGKGAEADGGRWNRKGVPVVYTASNVSLAVLETIVHTNVGALPLNRYLLEISVPDDVWQAAEVPAKSGTLPAVWNSLPVAKETLDFGDTWIREKRSLLLLVPSVVVPMENNILINPAHPEASQVKILSATQFRYDSRIRS